MWFRQAQPDGLPLRPRVDGYRAGMSSADSSGWRWWTLVALCAATFMLLVDVTVVQVALPTIQRDLHSGFTDLQWVIDAYALSLASVILTCGALADRFGRKRVFIVGLVAGRRLPAGWHRRAAS
jgi:MFS family permease